MGCSRGPDSTKALGRPRWVFPSISVGIALLTMPLCNYALGLINVYFACFCSARVLQSLSRFFSDMSSTAFIEPLPVIEFVAQVLGKDVSSRPLSDSDRVKVYSSPRDNQIT